MVTVGSGSKGTRFVTTSYPQTEGLVAGTTKKSDDYVLIPQEGSNVLPSAMVGL